MVCRMPVGCNLKGVGVEGGMVRGYRHNVERAKGERPTFLKGLHQL